MLKVVTANPPSVQADINVRTAAQSMTATSLPVAAPELQTSRSVNLS